MGVPNVIGATAVLLLFLISMHLSEAGRVLLDKEGSSTMKNRLFILTESKQKGSQPPSGHHPGTNIPSPCPTNGHAVSTINERNFAGHSTTEKSMRDKLFILMESEQKGVPPPGGPNGHTNIPGPATPTGGGHAASTINQRNFAGLLQMRSLTSGFQC